MNNKYVGIKRKYYYTFYLTYSAQKPILNGHMQLVFGKGGLRHLCCHKDPDTTYNVDTAADMMEKFAAFAGDPQRLLHISQRVWRPYRERPMEFHHL
jgi:hypothetical protein